MGESDKKRLQAFEIWGYRRIFKISWREKITNEKKSLEELSRRRGFYEI